MYPIVKKRVLNEEVSLMEVRAPLAARRARPGQFIILRVDENGERIPLTIADFDREKGTVTVIFQKVGATTKLLDQKNEGDTLADFVGPLGKASEFDGVHRAAVIGGGRVSAGQGAQGAGRAGRFDRGLPEGIADSAGGRIEGRVGRSDDHDRRRFERP